MLLTSGVTTYSGYLKFLEISAKMASDGKSGEGNLTGGVSLSVTPLARAHTAHAVDVSAILS